MVVRSHFSMPVVGYKRLLSIRFSTTRNKQDDSTFDSMPQREPIGRRVRS